MQSTKCAACAAIRRPAQLGHRPRFLQENLFVTPACGFAWKSRTLTEPYAGLAPDRRVALTTGKAWFTSPKLLTRTPPTCSTKVEFEATVGNAHASETAIGEFMLDRNGRGNPEYAINGHFSLPPRQERVVRFNRPFEGRAKSTLSLKMASSSRVPAISGTTTIEATRLCRITSVELR